MTTTLTGRTSTRAFKSAARRFRAECEAKRLPCWLCGMPIDYQADPTKDDDAYQLDHLYPVSKRPDLQDDPAGFRPSHRSCNIARGNKDPSASLGSLTREWT